MNAADIMTRDVVCAAPDTSIPDVVNLLLRHRISGLPVVEAGAVIGVISEGDLVRRAAAEAMPRHHSWLARLTAAGSIAADYVHHHGSRARDLMTAPAITVPAHTPMAEVAALMQRRGLKRLPVIDADGMLAGIVTRANLLQAMASRPTAPAAPANDAALRATLLAHIAAQPWAGVARGANIIVNEGVVHLWGAVPDPAARRAIVVAAETLAGTRAVADHFDAGDEAASVDPLDRPNWPTPGRP